MYRLTGPRDTSAAIRIRLTVERQFDFLGVIRGARGFTARLIASPPAGPQRVSPQMFDVRARLDFEGVTPGMSITSTREPPPPKIRPLGDTIKSLYRRSWDVYTLSTKAQEQRFPKAAGAKSKEFESSESTDIARRHCEAPQRLGCVGALRVYSRRWTASDVKGR